MTQIAIMEFGSQHTLEIDRLCREGGYWAEIISPHDFDRLHAERNYRCAIGSGSHYSVYAEGAPKLPASILPQGSNNPIPYFGICYGMQVSMHQLGGLVEPGKAEYARAQVLLKRSPLFDGLSNLSQEVWMSHGDKVASLAPEFDLLGLSDGIVAAVAHQRVLHVGTQFHPEVANTPQGKVLLYNFLRMAGCVPDYSPDSLPDVIRNSIRAKVGKGRALIGFSGGVDSSVLAKVAHLELGDDLLCILIDGGHMRLGEVEEVRAAAKALGLNLKVVDAKERFFTAMVSTTDVQIRDIFSRIYSEIFREEAFAWDNGHGVVILQGTIGPDRIESGETGGAKIKKHHNVGLDFGNIPQMAPLGSLFKDEVRALARQIDLPESTAKRMPFPGPGNFLRGVNDAESAEVVSWAERRVREICAEHLETQDLDQIVVANLGRAPGVKGDGPVYGYIIGVRGIRTTRYMTVEGHAFSPKMQMRIDKALTEGHRLITFTAYIPTPKPPGMVELK